MSQPDMLEIINGPEDGTEFPINRAPLIIGSDMSCEVNVRLDEAVQRYHARLTAVGDGYRVRKIHGGNLAVNGKSTGVIRSRVLREGSILTVGNTEFYLRCAPDGLARRSRGLPVENDVVWTLRVLGRKLWAAAWWVGTLSGGTSRIVRGLIILFIIAAVAGYIRPGLVGEIQYFIQQGIASIQQLLAPFLSGPS
jgi:hypothetical protein